MDQISTALSELAVALEHLSRALKRDIAITPKTEAKTEATTETRFVKSDKPAPPIEEIKKTAEDVSEPIKLEIVRALLATLTQQGKREEVKQLLLKYGAPKLSGIDPKNYVALVKDAQALANNAA